MPFNSVLVVSAATISAGAWQDLACLPERIGREQLLDLVLCFPLQQLGRWFMYAWTYLCVSAYPASHHHYADSYYDHDSDNDEDSQDGDRHGRAYSAVDYAQYLNHQDDDGGDSSHSE